MTGNKLHAYIKRHQSPVPFLLYLNGGMSLKRKTLTVGSLISKNRQMIPSEEIPKEIDVQPASIRLRQNQSYFEVVPRPHQTLLDAALEQKQFIDFKCRKGTCGRCKVRVTEGASLLHPPHEKERIKLQHSLAQEYRLACQAMIR
jgi:ferredoxin